MATSSRRPLFIDRVGQRRHRPDYWLLLLSVILLVMGLIVIYAISPGLSVQNGVSENYYVSKQLIAIGLGVVAFVVLANTPLSFWRHVQKPLIIMAAVAALLVRFFGDSVNGAYRWIQIGGISFQAAELIKFALLIWLASFLAERMKTNSLTDKQRTIRPIFIALILVLGVVAIIQKDLGSTGVMIAMMAVMTYVAGMPLKKVALIGGVVLIGLILAVSSFSYRRDRLQTFLHPERDCLNTGYQACEALISVGSGGMFGLGLAKSVQAYGYLPEAENDSIFAIFAEKFGFFGCAILIIIFLAFFARLANIAEHAPDDFSRLLITGILAWLSVQAIINIGAMIGLLPLKGITLPFISYGGTSLLFVTGAIGLAFQISRYTTYSIVSSPVEGKQNDNYINGRRDRRSHYTPVSRRP